MHLRAPAPGTRSFILAIVVAQSCPGAYANRRLRPPGAAALLYRTLAPLQDRGRVAGGDFLRRLCRDRASRTDRSAAGAPRLSARRDLHRRLASRFRTARRWVLVGADAACHGGHRLGRRASRSSPISSKAPPNRAPSRGTRGGGGGGG